MMKRILIRTLVLALISCRTVPNIPLGNISMPSTSSTDQYQPSSHTGKPKSFELENNYKSESSEFYDPYPDIDGHGHAQSMTISNYEGLDAENIKRSAKNVKIINSNETNKQCKIVESKVRIYLNSISDQTINETIQVITAENFGNLANVYRNETVDGYRLVHFDIHNCPKLSQRENPTKLYINTYDSFEFEFFMGTYIARNGFLKLLGETGPTVGFTFGYYYADSSDIENLKLGFHLHFNFDHFSDTDSTFLQPKFTNEDFTNYLWSIGPSLKWTPTSTFSVNYHLGLGINFLEIDTNRTNQELDDDEATRTTISGVHQLGFYSRLQNNLKYGKHQKSDTLLGLNFLYYWMPDPLGKFADNNTNLESYGGGSYAIMLSLKFQKAAFPLF